MTAIPRCPKSGLKRHFGTPQNRIREIAPSSLYLPSSRTQVTIFSDFQAYRFFADPAPSSSSDARFLLNFELYAHGPLLDPAGADLSRNLVPRAGRHARTLAANSRRRMLLPLRGSTPRSWMYENVRTTEICFALVGHKVRQTSDQRPGGESRRQPTLAASRPRRTRQAVINSGHGCAKERGAEPGDKFGSGSARLGSSCGL
jgi:hypothetical protein